jgi:predicted nucleotidyltransferase
MRLSESELQAIISALHPFLRHTSADLYLFGSRTDDRKKGGDIDLLLVFSAGDDAPRSFDLIGAHAGLLKSLGERKIDLLLAKPSETDPFFEQIKASRIKIAQWRDGALVAGRVDTDSNKRILAISKPRSESDAFAIFSDFSELSFSDLLTEIRNNQFPSLNIAKSKSGREFIRSKPNGRLEDNIANHVFPCGPDDSLFFNGKELRLLGGNGHSKDKWSAVSGAPGSQPKDQSRADYGPIPVGDYTARFDQTISLDQSQTLWDAAKWLIKYPQWGWIATPLEPHPETQTFGRSGFYLHGGLFPGSKGCIDLLDQNEVFHIRMRLYRRNLKLKVEYGAI